MDSIGLIIFNFNLGGDPDHNEIEIGLRSINSSCFTHSFGLGFDK